MARAILPQSYMDLPANGSGVESLRAVTQTHRLPFDRFRANGGVLKSCDSSVHAELVEA